MLTPEQTTRLKLLADRQQELDRSTAAFFAEVLQPLLAAGHGRNAVLGAASLACADDEGQLREMPSTLNVQLMLWGR